MPIQKRKRHMISLSEDEFTKLSALKHRWESWTDEKIDWGAFLMQATASAAAMPIPDRNLPIEPQGLREFAEKESLPSSITDVLTNILNRLDDLEQAQPISEIDRLLAE